jgi:hypothetical protein
MSNGLIWGLVLIFGLPLACLGSCFLGVALGPSSPDLALGLGIVLPIPIVVLVGWLLTRNRKGL